MISCWFSIIVVGIVEGPLFVETEASGCQTIDIKSVKVEAWLSKRYEKN